jgi:hypothetical protein
MPIPTDPITRAFYCVPLVSSLILIARFATLESMKIKSVTPIHHLMIMANRA